MDRGRIRLTLRSKGDRRGVDLKVQEVTGHGSGATSQDHTSKTWVNLSPSDPPLRFFPFPAIRVLMSMWTLRTLRPLSTAC